VLIPALALAEIHWHRGELNDDRHKFILQSLREIIEDLGQRKPEVQAEAAAKKVDEADEASALSGLASSAPICILCLPARDEADEIATTMLAHVLEANGCIVHAISVTARPSEMIDLVEKHQPAVVCISATPPAAVIHARYLCTRLLGRMPELKLVVGLWDSSSDLPKAQKRIGGGAKVQVVATLADSQQLVRRLLQPLLPSSLEKLDGGQSVMEKACS
jgi:hypothetical protein